MYRSVRAGTEEVRQETNGGTKKQKTGKSLTTHKQPFLLAERREIADDLYLPNTDTKKTHNER